MAENEESSRHIPELLKRAVRRRCGFGCVVCGLPVYHYDHIVDFATVKEHTEDNITLSCPNHHHEKTARQIPLSKVIACNNDPVNRSRDKTSKRMMYFRGEDAVIKLGASSFTMKRDCDKYEALVMGSTTVLAFEREADDLLLSMHLRDVLLNDIAVVTRGELILSTNISDYSYVGRRMTIVPKFLPPFIISRSDNVISVERGLFFGWGTMLDVNPDRIIQFPGNNTFRIHAEGGRAGMVLNDLSTRKSPSFRR